MNYKIFYPQTELQGKVRLPASKSLSARALLIEALSGGGHLENLSDCDDTRVLRKALHAPEEEIDIMAAGTAMRFATAYFATREGEEHIITGTERMRQRPIRPLVDALRQLGADIEYTGKEGFPPLKIRGTRLTGGNISIPADISSQYISALLMIGPTLKNGLTLNLLGEVASRPYINMTLGVMRTFGAEAEWQDQQSLAVKPKPYRAGITYCIEPDWSAASYWYEMAALNENRYTQLLLAGLKEDSLQGDACVAKWFEPLGVKTAFSAEGAVLTPCPATAGNAEWPLDFSDCPDLAQTFVVTAALKRIKFKFTGLKSLLIKETDRIAALQSELAKLGYGIRQFQTTVNGHTDHGICYDGNRGEMTDHNGIDTFEDHRMAMSFAPAALKFPGLRINHPEVVSKSYPDFWNDLRGFGVQLDGQTL